MRQFLKCLRVSHQIHSLAQHIIGLCEGQKLDLRQVFGIEIGGKQNKFYKALVEGCCWRY